MINATRKMPIIPVKLDDAKQPDVLERSITAKNAIMAERYSPAELADRIAGAESLNPPKLTAAQTGANKLRLGLILGAAIAALVAALFLIGKQTVAFLCIQDRELVEESRSGHIKNFTAVFHVYFSLWHNRKNIWVIYNVLIKHIIRSYP